MFIVAASTGCNDVQSRLNSTTRQFWTHGIGSPEIDGPIRAKLAQATPATLTSPDLVLARLTVAGTDAKDLIHAGQKARQCSLIIFWIEAYPSPTGVRLFSPAGDDQCDLEMDSERLALCQKDAETSVLYGLTFTYKPGMKEFGQILEVLKAKEVRVALTRNGEVVGQSVLARIIYLPDDGTSGAG